jgi:hypothetical protein
MSGGAVATCPGSACATGGGYTIHEDMSRSKLWPNLQQQDHPRARNESIRLVGLPAFSFCDPELLEETLDQCRAEAVGERYRSA